MNRLDDKAYFHEREEFSKIILSVFMNSRYGVLHDANASNIVVIKIEGLMPVGR